MEQYSKQLHPKREKQSYENQMGTTQKTIQLCKQKWGNKCWVGLIGWAALMSGAVGPRAIKLVKVPKRK